MKRLALILALLSTSAFAAAAQPAHSITLTWTWTQGSGGLATSFNVLRATATGTTCPAVTTFTQLASVANTAPLTYVDNSSTTNTLTEGTTYCYIVAAAGSRGCVA